MPTRWLAGSLIAVIMGALPVAAQAQAANVIIDDGSRVQLEYTLRDDAGTVLDSNQGREPLAYTQGQKQILPALEQALRGMRDGETKKVTLKPEDGYGAVDPKAQVEVPAEQIPEAARTVGSQLLVQGPRGDQRPVRVKEVKDKTIVLDLNHPLAGKTLVFELRILKIEPPP